MLHPHVPEDLKHFSKHLFATFLGLLMALGLESWREHRQETKLAEQALAGVETELREDLSWIDRETKRCDESLRATEQLDAYLSDLIAAKRRGQSLPPIPPQVSRMGIMLNFPTDAWETFKGLGALRYISPDRARRLSRAYLRLGSLRQGFDSHPAMRQIPGSLLVQLEQPERLLGLDVPHLEQVRESLQIIGVVFRWARHEIGFAREGCEAALKP